MFVWLHITINAISHAIQNQNQTKHTMICCNTPTQPPSPFPGISGKTLANQIISLAQMFAAKTSSNSLISHPQELTCVGQTEGPETQIRGRVRDAAQAILNSVDCLMHYRVAKVKLSERWKRIGWQWGLARCSELCSTPSPWSFVQNPKKGNERRGRGRGEGRKTANRDWWTEPVSDQKVALKKTTIMLGGIWHECHGICTYKLKILGHRYEVASFTQCHHDKLVFILS